MKFITIVAILGFSSHANAAIPAPTADIGDEKIDQRPLLRGSGMPEFFKDILHSLPTEIDNEDASFESGQKIKVFNPTKAARGLTESAHGLSKLASDYAKFAKVASFIENIELALEEEKEVSSTVKNTALKLERGVTSALKDILKPALILSAPSMYEDEEEEFVSEPMDLSFLDELIAKYEAKIPDNVDLEEVAFVGKALSAAASSTAYALDGAAQATADAASVASKATADAMGTASSTTVAALDTAVATTGTAMSSAVGTTAAALKF